MKALLATVIVFAGLVASHAAWAGCRIHNDTKWDFKIESGNTSNQSVGPHTTSTIAAGKIKGVDGKEGKSVSGTCKEGDTVEITDDHGVPVLSVK